MRKRTVVISALVVGALVVGGIVVLKALAPSDGAPPAASVRCEPGYSPPVLWNDRAIAVLHSLNDLETPQLNFSAYRKYESGIETMRVTIDSVGEPHDDLITEVKHRSEKALCGLHVEVHVVVDVWDTCGPCEWNPGCKPCDP